MNALQAASGGHIAFRGQFRFASQLVTYPNIALMGSAPFGYFNPSNNTAYGAVIISGYDGDCILVSGDARGSTFPYLANFQILGSHTYPRQNGINVCNAGGMVRDCFIDNIFIDGMGQHGFVLSANSTVNTKVHTNRLYIENCAGNGVDGSAGANCTLTMLDSYIVGNSGIGFNSPASALDWSLIGGSIGSSGGSGIVASNGTSQARVIGMFLGGNGSGATPQISVPSLDYDSARLIIEGNNFSGSNNNHIHLGDSGNVTASIIGNAFYSGGQDAIAWMSRAGHNILIKNNLGYNDKGKIASPFNTPSCRVGAAGTAASPTPSATYTVEGTDLMLAVSDGADISITIADPAGNTVVSGLTSYTGVLPIGYSINFGAFSAAPTVYAGVV